LTENQIKEKILKVHKDKFFSIQSMTQIPIFLEFRDKFV